MLYIHKFVWLLQELKIVVSGEHKICLTTSYIFLYQGPSILAMVATMVKSSFSLQMWRINGFPRHYTMYAFKSRIYLH